MNFAGGLQDQNLSERQNAVQGQLRQKICLKCGKNVDYKVGGCGIL